MKGKSRRTFLFIVGATMSGSAGCLSDDTRPAYGSIVIDNEENRTYSAEVHIRKLTSNPDDIPLNESTPAQPPSEDLWEDTKSYDIKANMRIEDPEFIQEPGTFYLTVQLDDGQSTTEWMRLSKGAVEPVHGPYLHVRITDSLSVYTAAPE